MTHPVLSAGSIYVLFHFALSVISFVLLDIYLKMGIITHVKIRGEEMYGLILFIHVVVCVLLVIVVLLQQTKGAGLSSVFGGGGGTESVFGGKGATPFFVKLTTGLAIGFFVTSLSLVLLSRRPIPKSAVEKGLEEVPVQTAPGIPQDEGPFIPEEGPVMPEEPGPGGE